MSNRIQVGGISLKLFDDDEEEDDDDDDVDAEELDDKRSTELFNTLK